MKKTSLLFLIFLFMTITLFSQERDIEKINQLKFCGYKFKKPDVVKRNYEPQLRFLNIHDRDTVIDVGTSSGSYIGALNMIGGFKKAHFILVDIDSVCLNQTKVNNMIGYYQKLGGAVFDNTFSIVVNSFDSLNLPLGRYKKLLIMNTLHEIDDKVGMARQIASVLQPGGEVIIGEMLPVGKTTIHGGCRKPLLSADEIINIFSAAGFKFIEKENFQPVEKQKDKHPYYFFRLVKM